jgi:hypothetical protein
MIEHKKHVGLITSSMEKKDIFSEAEIKCNWVAGDTMRKCR